MNSLITRIRQELRSHASEANRISGQRYFKEEVNLYGVKSADVMRIGKTYFQEIKEISKKEIFELCEEMWQSGYLEEHGIASAWSYNLRKNFQTEDFMIFEKWVDQYVYNWASCDTFCNHTMGAFIEKFPDFLMELKKWARSPNRWTRRASAVSLIIPARKGKFLADIFDIAEILLQDKDDMVQKGYGWMLKAASQAHQKDVFDFVISQKGSMPRTAFRYAIEKMPPELRRAAMGK